MALLLLLILIALFMAGLPTWGYSRNWGYGPSSGVGLVLLMVLVLLLLGHLGAGRSPVYHRHPGTEGMPMNVENRPTDRRYDWAQKSFTRNDLAFSSASSARMHKRIKHAT